MITHDDALDLLHSIFESTCIDVFEGLGCSSIRVTQAKEKVAVPCAYIEASSNDILATLLLRGPISFLKSTFPNREKQEIIKPTELDDWISELANRFMGNFKNKLIPYEHTLALGIPVSQFGINIDEFISDDHDTFVLYFDVGHEVFECSLHTKILNEGITFNYEVAADESGTDDGELELF